MNFDIGSIKNVIYKGEYLVTYFNAIEFVASRVARQTLTDVASDDVHAPGVRVAVVAVKTTRLLAFVDICNTIFQTV